MVSKYFLIKHRSINSVVFILSLFLSTCVSSLTDWLFCVYTNTYGPLLTSNKPTLFFRFSFSCVQCNSINRQENGSPDEIKTFALSRANRLMVTERSVVNGSNPHPIVALAKSKYPGRIAWNFDGRFIFNRQGQPVARFSNSASASEIDAAIQKHL